MTRPIRHIVALLGLVALAGCGVKSAPQPPVITLAEATRDLEVRQDDRQAVLSWSYPAVTTAGQPLTGLESVEVWRATMLEVEAPPPAERPRDRDLNRQLVLATGEKIADLDRAALDGATRGARLEWRDDLEAWHRNHPAEKPQMVWYAVRTLCCRGRESELSNIARLVPVRPPPPPTGLELSAEPGGVRLTWAPHEELPAIVERSSDGATWSALDVPPLATGEWLDRSADQGAAWNYRLRTVVEREGDPRVVGSPGPAIGLFYPDIYPPDAPADLVCLPEGMSVRLRWRSAGGAISYRVLRREGGEPPTPLAEGLTATQFEDLEPPPGTSTYEVEAVDGAGNRSPPASCGAAGGSAP